MHRQGFFFVQPPITYIHTHYSAKGFCFGGPQYASHGNEVLARAPPFFSPKYTYIFFPLAHVKKMHALRGFSPPPKKPLFLVNVSNIQINPRKRGLTPIFLLCIFLFSENYANFDTHAQIPLGHVFLLYICMQKMLIDAFLVWYIILMKVRVCGIV